MPRTSRKAARTRSAAGSQYTRAGSGPRVSDGHGVTLVSDGPPRSRRHTALRTIGRDETASCTRRSWTGTTSTPATCRGGSRRRPRGRCWSPSSCCSRRRWPGCCRSRGLAGALAHPGRPRGRARRRGGAGLGAARLPPPGTPAARRRHRDRRASTTARSPTTTPTCSRCPASGDYTAAAVASFALRTAPRRARHQRAPGPGPAGRRRRAPGRLGHARASGTGRPTCCPRTSPPRPRGRWRSWSSAPWSARRQPRAATRCPVADLCALARGRLPGVRRTGPRRGQA